MKYYITLILILCGYFVRSQDKKDTIVDIHVIDSMKWEIKELKEANKKLEYNYTLQKNLYKIDTNNSNKDSIVINFIDKDGKILKQEINEYFVNVYLDSADKNHLVKTNSVVNYFNSFGLLEFSEAFANYATVYDAPVYGEYMMIPTLPIRTSYFRIEYDDKKRKVLEVFVALNTFYEFILRTKKYYNEDGSLQKTTEETIPEYNFWE